MTRRVVVGLAVLVLFGVLAPPATGAGTQPLVSTQPEFDNTAFEITVFANGTARWTFEYSRPLTNDTEREQFREFAHRFNSENLSFYTSFKDRARRLVDAGRNATGRNMTTDRFEKRAFVGDLGNRGIVRMSFHWTAFGERTGDGVLVSDVFEGGLYVAPDQRLTVRTGPSLSFETVEPAADVTSGSSLADSDSVTWRGERTFSDNHPRIRMTASASTTRATATPPAGAATTTASTPTSTATTSSPTATTTLAARGDSDPMGMVMAGLLLAAITLGAAVLYRSGGLGRPGDRGGTSPDAGATGQVTTTESPATEGTEEPVAEEELLSDTDRVIRMLEENGGQMKQVAIVDNTDWSKSKVSMLLSDMEEDGQISKLRVGRENIISFRGQGPEAASSPFEDE